MGNEWIEAILDLMQRHGIAEFEYEDADRHIITSAGVAAEATRSPRRPTPPPQACETLVAPHIGIFQAAHPRDGEDAALPRLVRCGEIVGYLKAGPLLRPAPSPSDGVLSRRLVDDGVLVGYGTPLFEFHRSQS
ncbi:MULTISPECIES: hypothetical protein [Alphaproteobacteria]|uniref:Biotin attachment protein n=2 Tax=Alphaproteobacteria TaxID=28211 RepID=A0A512HDR1_9HYPH|nr:MULTISPECIES: hypothetical protein [Alphaproteobacteria]GEO83586.1 biotin attachment protein [Ciceribacter naphthalenivorans]GLR24262.1 biotin attachment protein [Ciceribacter naphthalenivorans]GLT07118.1 biotin attachment protein [Sphingomonas psychrolutea]